VTLILRGGEPFNPGPLTAATDRANRSLVVAETSAVNAYASHAEFEGQCGRCHAPFAGVTAERCEQCHTSITAQRSNGDGLHGRLTDTHHCENCHTDHKGRAANINVMGLAGFDHDRLTLFSLARHRQDYQGDELACPACHGENEYGSAIDCWSCHEAAAPEFVAGHTVLFGSDCLACHDGVDTAAEFEHAAVFPLEGAHAEADCSACHELGETFLAGSAWGARATRDCVACHAEPEIHAGLFGTDCQRCHTVASWVPAELTQHTFPLDHGGEGKIPCQGCHVSTYANYTCTNCHAHDPAATRDKHLEQDIADAELADCAACHPTGSEDEAGENDD
jgi:hypothetical protein